MHTTPTVASSEVTTPEQPRALVAGGIVLALAITLGIAFFGEGYRETTGWQVTDFFSFGTVLAFAVVVLPLLVAQYVMGRTGRRWADYGLHGAWPWWRVAIMAVLTWLAVNLAMRFALVPLLQALAAPPPNASHLMGIRGNPVGFAGALAVVWLTAAFGEELLFRGFLLNETAGLLGGGRGAWLGAIVLVSVVFGVGHAYQGLSGVIITGTVSLVFGLLYLLFGRNLWVMILAHGVVDTVSLTRIFLA